MPRAAWGIAALLLPGCRMKHPRFKFPDTTRQGTTRAAICSSTSPGSRSPSRSRQIFLFARLTHSSGLVPHPVSSILAQCALPAHCQFSLDAGGSNPYPRGVGRVIIFPDQGWEGSLFFQIIAGYFHRSLRRSHRLRAANRFS